MTRPTATLRAELVDVVHTAMHTALDGDQCPGPEGAGRYADEATAAVCRWLAGAMSPGYTYSARLALAGTDPARYGHGAAADDAVDTAVSAVAAAQVEALTGHAPPATAPPGGASRVVVLAETLDALSEPVVLAELTEVLGSVPAHPGPGRGEVAARAVLDYLIGRLTEPAGAQQSPALALIAAERRRHFTASYDAAYDDRFDRGELAQMGRWYADPDATVTEWPWDDDWPTRDGGLADLIRGASLLAAEADRMIRAGATL